MKKNRNILLKIEKLPEGPYLGTSDDVQGLVVQEDTVEQVIATAQECAQMLLEFQEEVHQKKSLKDTGENHNRTRWQVYHPMQVQY